MDVAGRISDRFPTGMTATVNLARHASRVPATWQLKSGLLAKPDVGRIVRRAPRQIAFCSLLAFTLIDPALRADSVRDEALRRDLDVLTQQIIARHPNPFTKITRSDFDRRARELSDSIPILSDRTVYARLMALAASIGDAHTSIIFDGDLVRAMGLGYFPIRGVLYDDGLYVAVTSASYADFLGWRILSINGRTPEEWMEILLPFVSHDNEQWLRHNTVSLLQYPQLLHAVDPANEPDSAEWVLESRLGKRETLVLESAPARPSFAAVNDPSLGYLSPTYHDLNLNYWYRYFPEQSLLFFKYNVCQPRSDLPFSAFVGDLFRTLDAQPVDYLVVDLRDNTGGNSEVWRPFLAGLESRYATLQRNPKFRFYGLISRLTFSSGMFAAQEIKRFPGAMLVGEDTGGNPNAFGNVFTFRLSNSGINVQVSTRYFSAFAPGVSGPTVRADVRAYRDSAEVFARFDPVLFKVFALSDPRAPRGAEDRSRPLVSAASLRPGSPQSSNSLSTLFGDFERILEADPADLTLTVSGSPAILLQVLRNQINFQQPSGMASGEREVVLAMRDEVIWRGMQTVAEAAPAIFIKDPSDFRSPGSILNDDGAINSREQPARRGQKLRIFATGYPATLPEIEAGAVPPAGVLVQTVSLPRVLIGHWDMKVLFSGPSPVQPGLWQIDAKIPDREGISGLMPVVVLSEGRLSNAVTIWVERP